MLSIWPSTSIRVAGLELASAAPRRSCRCRRRRCRDRGPRHWHRSRRPAGCWRGWRLVGIESRCSVATLLQQPRHRIAVRGAVNVADRRVLRSFESSDAMLRRLHREIIGRAVARIGPEIRRHLHRRAQADIEVGRDAVDGEAELGGAGAVDLGKNSGRSTSCCIWTSAMPGIAAIRSLQLLGDRAGSLARS